MWFRNLSAHFKTLCHYIGYTFLKSKNIKYWSFSLFNFQKPYTVLNHYLQLICFVDRVFIHYIVLKKNQNQSLSWLFIINSSLLFHLYSCTLPSPANFKIKPSWHGGGAGSVCYLGWNWSSQLSGFVPAASQVSMTKWGDSHVTSSSSPLFCMSSFPTTLACLTPFLLLVLESVPGIMIHSSAELFTQLRDIMYQFWNSSQDCTFVHKC